MRKLKWETKHGINIEGIADDIILTSSSAQDLEMMLRDLDTVSRDIGLTMNTSKIKIMTNANVIPIHMRSTDRVHDELHLPRSDPVLLKLSRKRNEKTYCTSLEEILEPETHLDGQTSENELEGAIPVLTYGCQTWPPCRTPEKAEGTWGDNGRDGLTAQKIAGDQWSRSAKDSVLWKELEKTLTL